MTITLGYWSIHGRGEPIRLLLNYVGADWENKIYYMNPEGFADWGKFKETTDMIFPNLPYLIDGDVKMSESLAILRYLGAKFDLVEKDHTKAYRVDMMEQLLQDVVNAFINLNREKDGYEKAAEKYKADLPGKLEKFGKFLGKGNYVAGKKLTYVDFMLYEVLIVHKMFSPASFTDDTINEYMNTFSNLPGIKSWLQGEQKSKGFHVLPAMFAWTGAPN